MRIKTSKYKGVNKSKRQGKVLWMSQYRANGHNWQKWHKTERDAAIAFDIKMIQIGKNPVNILKPKLNI